MPSHQGTRPLKAWRYVGVYGPELMLCVAAVRIGPVRHSFWAVWDRINQRFYEGAALGRGGVRLRPGEVLVRDRGVEIDLRLEETGGIETICPSGASYAWTRKQGGIAAQGTVIAGGETFAVDDLGLIDDTAGYYQRHTRWRWSAGVGVTAGGSPAAWNLVEGVNDPGCGSERTVWIDGVATEAQPSRFSPDLSGVDGLRFAAEAVRERRENRLIVRSNYRQPFGTFSGTLPGGEQLGAGWGVMEEHDVHW
jgi:hypothetical protein